MSVATAERWFLPMIGAFSPCLASTPSAAAATAVRPECRPTPRCKLREGSAQPGACPTPAIPVVGNCIIPIDVRLCDIFRNHTRKLARRLGAPVEHPHLHHTVNALLRVGRLEAVEAASTGVASSAKRGPGTIAVHSCPRACTGRMRTIRLSAYASLDSTYFGTREAAIRARVSSTRAT